MANAIASSDFLFRYFGRMQLASPDKSPLSLIHSIKLTS